MNKRILVPLVIVGLVAISAAAIFGPYIYRDYIAADTLPTPTITQPSSNTPAKPVADGTWRIGGDSYAGYRVNEVLRGVPVTVVGRTDEVSGSATIEKQTVTEATVAVDITSVATDQSQRDSYFRANIADVDKHPTAQFTLDGPIDISSEAGIGTLELTGSLTLHGITKRVTISVEAGRSGDIIQVAGSIPVVWDDYGIVAPDLTFVTVEKSGTIEFLLQFSTQP